MPSLTTRRINSIDILRGIVMIVMALDHTRDFFHIGAITSNPLAPATTTTYLFFTRWITHFCAPTFVFLSGLSAYLSSQKKNFAEASLFMINRGVWLIFVEVVIVTFGLTFDPKFRLIVWQVIWVIACSMILLAFLRQLGNKWVLLIGLVLVFGHDLVTNLNITKQGTIPDIVRIFFTVTFIPIDSTHTLGAFYSILPWTGIMFLGYGIGHWFNEQYDAKKRKRNLLAGGLTLIALFIIIRMINKYGDPSRWQHIGGWRGFLSFLNTSKYPPSLLYTCMTIGPTMVFLALTENIKTFWSRIAMVYGKVPFFYYILHFYILHVLLVIFFFASGHTTAEIRDPNTAFLFRLQFWGYNIKIVYLIWIAVVASLYFPCRWFYKYKTTHSQWWLKYL
jgi:uncharacterized membrane protein